MKNIIAHGSKGDLESVLTLWQRVCVLCVDISKKMSDSVEKAIIAALDVEEKMVGFKSFSLLFEVVKEENLFTESTQQLKLLKLLSESKNHDMQQLFLNLLNHRKYVNLEVAKMSPLISLWFLNVLQDIKIKSGMHEKDKVPQFYVNFSKIIRTNYVMQHAKIQQKLEDITLKVMQKCKFKTMILAIPEIEVSTDLSDIYTKHISRILKDGYLGKNVNDIIQDICGVGSTKLVINSR
ncbi:unnamed protein product [Mytilus edulis]|uniref:Uncharacterized protein n=1 Tax=Mytilus edulis TaxID=6550 RepID=A0A8S3RUY3_MYTED|nr:unnamed protein product [Mytilus edulis]